MLKRTLTQIKRSWLARRKRRTAGFTLLELLVSLIIGSLIVIAMLTLVLDITNADRKDAARTEVQRDMQLAMNYITQDLREAVYVYDGRCMTEQGNVTTNYAGSCPGLVKYLPTGWNADPTKVNTASQFTPLLAFWKPEELPTVLQKACQDAATDTSGTETSTKLNALIAKGVPCISGRSYSLIVYGLDTRNPSGIWKGRARLSRYRLSQYSESTDPTNPTNNSGWVNPKETQTSGFQQWPFISSDTGTIDNGQTVLPTNDSEVLIDFVDNGLPTSRTPAPSPPACSDPSVPTFSFPNVTSQFPASTAIPGLYGCVRGATLGAGANEQVVNQEVQLTLIGNIDGRGGFPINNSVTNYDTSGRVFPLQTRVLTRGILNKGA